MVIIHQNRGWSLIVVEGLDNTGKTSLVGELCERFPMLERRDSIGNTHDPESIFEGALWEAYSSPGLCITDRSRIISEWVYNPVLMNRPMAYDFRTWMKLVSSLAVGRHLILFMWRPIEELLETFDERSQLPGVRENIVLLHHRYNLVANMMELLFHVQPTIRGEIIWINYSTEKKYAFEATAKYLRDRGVDASA